MLILRTLVFVEYCIYQELSDYRLAAYEFLTSQIEIDNEIHI